MGIESLEMLQKTVMEYDAEGATNWARKALEEGVDPIKVANVLTEAIRHVGDSYGRGDLFLPDLVGAAGAMKSAMPIIQKEIRRRGIGVQTVGTVVVGTVYGDIHDIGKSMVSTLLAVGGFEVIDLGVNITAGGFIEAVKRHEPDILAMSSLMTVTASEQKKVLEALEKDDLRDRLKVMVGGGAITQEFAESIGADAYGVTALDAVKLAKELLG